MLAGGGNRENMKKGVRGENLVIFMEHCPEETVQMCSLRAEGTPHPSGLTTGPVKCPSRQHWTAEI